MSNMVRTGILATLILGSGALAACGPTLVNFDPSNATAIQVRPASGNRVFCPGEIFQVEVVAKLANGTSCSSTDRARGCQGEEDAVISPSMVRIEASAGGRTGKPDQFMWLPPENVLETADTGLVLRGWLEKKVEGQSQKSMVGQADLKPVYQCRLEGAFALPPAGGDGQPGVAGPDLNVAVTTLSTPYYPDAALIRVDSAGSRLYYISPSPEQAIRISSRGQDGGVGQTGASGVKGEDGKSAPSSAPACTQGESGRDGSDGGLGGPGGDGGPGGAIHVTLDKKDADKLRGRVLVESYGGAPGPGGAGGAGGPGGSGGYGGPTGQSCSDTKGADGRPGRTGPVGPAGRPGPNGAAPSMRTAARDALFAEELEILTRIESAKAKPAQ
jgi:hypothetical protein